MKELRQSLQNFFDTHERFLNDIETHDTWLAFNCYAISQQYTFISPKTKRSKEFLERLDSLSIKYTTPSDDEKVKKVVLSDLIVDNLDSQNAIDIIISELEKNCAIIKNSDLEDYLESLTIMNRLIDATNDKGFTRISYINTSHKYNAGIMRKILNPLFKNYSQDIETAHAGSLNSDIGITIGKWFDISEVVFTKKESDVDKLIHKIKKKEKVDLRKIPVFSDCEKTMMSFSSMYLNKASTDILKDYITFNMSPNVTSKWGQLYDQFVFETKETIKDELPDYDNGLKIHYGVKIPFLKLYQFVVDEIKNC